MRRLEIDDPGGKARAFRRGENVINEFDKVRIKGTAITGTVIDVHTSAGKTMCYVDSKQKGTPGEHGYDEDWALFYLDVRELEKI